MIQLGDTEFTLDPKDFPNLKNYKGQTLVHTDGTTLLGSDDKSGVAEIMTLADYLLNINPDFEHGEIRVGFGPDPSSFKRWKNPSRPSVFSGRSNSGSAL